MYDLDSNQGRDPTNMPPRGQSNHYPNLAAPGTSPDRRGRSGSDDHVNRNSLNRLDQNPAMMGMQNNQT